MTTASGVRNRKKYKKKTTRF